MTDQQPGRVRRFFRGLGNLLSALRTLIANVVLLLFLLLLFNLLFSSRAVVGVPDGAALVIDLKGSLVEQRRPVDPLTALLGGIAIAAPEVQLRDVVDAIDAATADTRIGAIYLRLDELATADSAKLSSVAEALQRFRAAGKGAIAYGDAFSQEQYFLASFADELYMNPMGQVLFTGYGMFDLFLKDALDKLKVSVHVFRVGTFKAAVEPFLRNEMSDEAKQANGVLIATLWQHYRDAVAANRKITANAVDDYLQQIDVLAVQAKGDLARLALEQRLVDELLTRDAVIARMAERVGKDDEAGFLQIPYEQYLTLVRAETLPMAKADQVAVLPASGVIVMDDPNGDGAGANQLAPVIRKLRLDERTKALVLRVDSPGGSALASEVIRAELELFQLSGKPLVVSMSGLAASGGYWISATADEIWADATTITGSIGIFGVVPTFENALSTLGVHADGVANAPVGAGLSPFRGLNNTTQTLFQQSVEHGYQQFVHLVARGRNLDVDTVEALAQGRVWPGQQAHELKLVDHLGGVEQAIAAAARRANLSDYETHYVQRQWNLRDQVLQALRGQLGLTGSDAGGQAGKATAIGRLLQQGRELVHMLQQLDDPRGMYALCEGCWLRDLR